MRRFITKRFAAAGLALAAVGGFGVAAAPSASAYSTLSFTDDPCYANTGQMALRMNGSFHVANDGSTATLYHGWFKAVNRTWVVTSSRWYSPYQEKVAKGYTGTYTAGSITPYWDPEAWYGWSPSRGMWGDWRVIGYAASDPSVTFSCDEAATP